MVNTRGIGEKLLLLYSPVFKRRYGVDGGFVLGCHIGCNFCYYRLIEVSAPYFGTGTVRTLADAEEFANFIEESKIIMNDKDLILIGAQSDASVQMDEVERFSDIFELRNPILLLHRAPYQEWEGELALSDDRLYLGTTLTPDGSKLGWTPVKEDVQLKGLKKLVELGVNPDRIPVEVGPINDLNIERSIEIIKALSELGFEHFIFRGCSIVSAPNNIPEKELFLLRKKGFIRDYHRKRPTYCDDGKEKEHEFYLLKNDLPEFLEKRIEETARDFGITPHRITATYYRDVIGIPLAYNRHNKVRFKGAKKCNKNKLQRMLEDFGFEVESIEWRGDHYYIELVKGKATEDIAMALGAMFETAAIFNRFTNSPDIHDLKRYWDYNLLALRKIRHANGLYCEMTNLLLKDYERNRLF